MIKSLSFVIFALLAIHSAIAADVSAGPIKLDANSVIINGKRTILLIGSFQYFRVDPSDWDRWLGMFEDSGYNTIDCYVPWNFHEPLEGQYDFTSPTHDLPVFLKLCQKHHLYVFLRGGPYICSEWDGGGIPAWTIPKEDFGVRSDNAKYLACIRPYLHQLDNVIKPYLATNGGPIILSQLENEHDYFTGCTEEQTLKYITRLRQYAKEDGIDIPLTACVGDPSQGEKAVRQATGLADGVMPTGNFYVSGNVEADAARFVDLLHRQTFAGGGSMSNLPALCTETDRDLNIQRRLLAGGLKGIAPFLFVGGSNDLFNNGDTNWKSPVAFIASSYDFGGMISFSGTKTPRWYDARRFAGAVNCVSSEMASASPDTNWEGQFSVSNARLGAREDENKPRRIYRLNNANGPSFIFLWNDSKNPEATTITVGNLTFPRHSTLTVPSTFDQIVPVNLSLADWGMPGLTLRYATNEFYHCSTVGDTTTLTLAGPAGALGEISFSAAPAKAFSAGVLQQFTDGGDWTAAYTVGAKSNFGLLFGDHHLHVQFVADEDNSAPQPTADPPTVHLATDPVWHIDNPPTAAGRSMLLGAGPQPFEMNGIYHGAAMYQTEFNQVLNYQPGYNQQGYGPQGGPQGQLPPGVTPPGYNPNMYLPPGNTQPPGTQGGPGSPPPGQMPPGYNPNMYLPPGNNQPGNNMQQYNQQGENQNAPEMPTQQLVIAGGGDIVTAILNGYSLGTKITGGNKVTFNATRALINGVNDLRIRVEVWGHSNFNDTAHPSTIINSPRGLWGDVTLGDAPLVSTTGWTLTPEQSDPSASAGSPSGPVTLGRNGQGTWISREFTVPAKLTPEGCLLKVDALDVLMHVFINGHPIGRLIFGPAANPQVTGGPADTLYVPSPWLNNGDLTNTINIFTLPTSGQAKINSIDLTSQNE
jgi:beta-galactosidase